MISQSLRIGLDYHGVIDQNIEYFSAFTQIAKARGHQVYIITGGPAAEVKQSLESTFIKFDFVFAVADYCFALGQIEQQFDGGIRVPQQCWNTAKADFCRRLKIDFHIDNGIEYTSWFSTPFCLYDSVRHCCSTTSGFNLNFNNNPEDVIKLIEDYVLQIKSI